MRGLKKIISFVLAITMVFGMISNPVSVQAAEGTSAYVADLLGYYKTYQEAAATDIERVLSEMKSVDEAAGEAWENIMNYWSDVNAEGFANIDTVPEGLPEDNSMAVVILGFALNPDGTMKEELIGRLQAGLNVANAYENCYVVVTGGGTAANNKDVTEGGLMGEWLLAQGLDEDRLIVENRAPSTVGNAQYTYEILKEKYPQVNSVVLVTSDYHIPRGCIIYYSKFVLDALRTGQEPLTIISNAGNNTGSNGYESISLQASGVSQVAGIAASSSVTLSVLDTITVSQDAAYVAGEELALTVNASYDSGYVRNVTDLVEVTDFDPALGADQSVTVTYTENGVTIKGKFALSETEKTINAYAMKLEKLVAEADVNRALYTDSSLEILDLAVANAEAVLADGKATDEDVLVATETLNKAVAALKERENVALKKPVTASVNSANAYKITDGNLGSYWETLEGGKNIPIDESYFVIDLQGIYDVDTIKAVPYFKGEERYYHYDISVSTDNENWEKVAEQRSTEDTLEAGAVFTLAETKEARYVKVDGVAVSVVGRDDINNFHVPEMMVYGNLVKEVEIEEAPKAVTNLAVYGKVTANEGASTNLDALTDGKINNTYSNSNAAITDSYVVVELPGEALLESFRVVTYYNNTSKWYTWEVLVSDDNETWTSVGKYETESNPGDAGYTITLDKAVSARYVKVQGLATNNNNLHLVEVEAYGKMDNILAGKPVSVNKYSSNNGAAAVDGNLGSYWDSDTTWASAAESDYPYAIIDLEGAYALDTVNVLNYRSGSRYYQYEIYTSMDGEEYTLLGEKKDDVNSYFSKNFDAKGTTARYIKFVGKLNSANSGFHLNELRATGTLVVEKTADYSAVEAAIAKVPADLSAYTAASVVDLKIAVANVEENLPVSMQKKVDAMAAAIESAVAALELIPVVTPDPTPIVTPDPTPEAVKIAADAMTLTVSGTSESSKGEAAKGVETTIDEAKAYLFDGNNTTFWRSNEVAAIVAGNPYLQLELDGEYVLSKVEVAPRWADGHAWNCTGSIQNVIVEVSLDGENWMLVTPENGVDLDANMASTAMAAVEFDATTAKFVRLSATKSYHWNSANANTSMTVAEVAVHGYAAPVVVTPDPTPVVTPDPTPVVTPDPTPVVTPEPTPVVTPEPTPEAVKIAVEAMTATASSVDTTEAGFDKSPAKALDGSNTTFWASVPNGKLADEWFQVAFDKTYVVSQVDYVGRWDAGAKWNCTGNLLAYVIEVSMDGENWTQVAAGEVADGNAVATFDAVEANFVRIKGTSSYHWQNGTNGQPDNTNTVMTIGDLAVYGYAAPVDPTPEVTPTPDPTPEVTPTPDPTPEVTPTPDPTPEVTPTPDPTPVVTPDPEPVAEELPLEAIVATTAGDYETDGGSSEGPAELATDGNAGTKWHTEWFPEEGNSYETHWLQLELDGFYEVSGFKYLPRQDQSTNGDITKYQILVSVNGKDWTVAAEGDFASGKEWKEVTFDAQVAKYVRLQAVETLGDQGNKHFTAAAEVRVIGLETEYVAPVDKAELETLLEETKKLDVSPYTEESVLNLLFTMNDVQKVVNNADATQEEVDAALATLQAAIDALVEKAPVVKPVDKTALQAAIDAANALDPYEYKDFMGVMDAIWEAQKVADRANATQEEVDAAKAALDAAVAALEKNTPVEPTPEPTPVPEADKSRLESLVNGATNEADDYTEESWAPFAAALEAAKAVLADENATQEEVDAARQALFNAALGLVKKPDPTPEVTPDPTPEVTPTPDPTPEVTPTPDPTPEVTPTPEPEPVPEVFPDVKEGAWYVPGVQFVYDNGLMSGSNGLFNPTADITRAQLVTTLYRLAGEPEVTDKSALTDFSDVPEGKYYTDAVCWAYETGVTTGTDGKFNPTDKLTRQQMAAFFFRYAEVMGMDTSARGDYSSMVNADKLSSYAKEPMAWAVGEGLISGSDVTVNGVAAKDLNPRGNTTRAQVATILMRFCAE